MYLFIADVHRLGLRLEDQSLIRNLGSFVSLPRMKEDILINFSRKLSLDSDSSEYASELSCAECDINDFVNSPDVGLDESAMDEAAVDRIASEDQRVDDLEISSKDNTCYRLWPPLLISLPITHSVYNQVYIFKPDLA